jgi:hypothetical protein
VAHRSSWANHKFHPRNSLLISQDLGKVTEMEDRVFKPTIQPDVLELGHNKGQCRLPVCQTTVISHSQHSWLDAAFWWFWVYIDGTLWSPGQESPMCLKIMVSYKPGTTSRQTRVLTSPKKTLVSKELVKSLGRRGGEGGSYGSSCRMPA